MIALAFLPLVRIAFRDLAAYMVPIASRIDWKNEIASAGYPAFAIFGSAAIVPWFLPLSIPVFVAVAGLFVCTWFSQGRKWLIYFLVTIFMLELSGQIDIKRVLFLTPWLFLAMGLAACSKASRHPWLASCAIATIVVSGWVGITSGNHYATADLNEPWEKVAKVVAQDARNGATIISENPSFFFYLDYQLGLESYTEAAPGTYLGDAVYRSHGFKVLESTDPQLRAENRSGKVILVIGSADNEDLQSAIALNGELRAHCIGLGQYRAAPDPAAAMKIQFTKAAPVLAYRTDVTWYDCLN